MDFQGFQNNLPVFITVLLIVFILLIAWLSYRGYSSIPKFSKILLSSLRASALLILGFLFLNPFFKTEKPIKLAPKVAIFLDDSESTSITKGNYEGVDSYKNLLNTINRQIPDEVSVEYFAFSNSIQPIKTDSLSFNKPATNLSEVISYINSLEGYRAVAIISDGIITYGKNPVIDAGYSPTPIYVIGIGDTSKVRDIAIQNISTNSTGFSNTNHIVTVDISQYAFSGRSISVSVLKDKIELQKKSLTLNKEIESVNFELTLTEPGLNQYEIAVKPLAEEWLTSNNKSNFSIDVLDSKTRILHIASSIHPDVKMLRSILSEDQNIELTNIDILGKDISSKSGDNNFDLVILHGYPSLNTISSLGLKVDDIPTLFLPLSELKSKANPEQPFILIESQSRQIIDASIYILEKNKNHPILEELPEIDFNRLAPIFTTTRSTLTRLDALTLATPQIQSINTSSPLLAVMERGNIRRSELHAYGWFKMYLSNNPIERKFVTNLFSNIVSWTATNPDNRLLKVNTSKNSYTVFENGIVNASLINENGLVEPNAKIQLTLTSEGVETSIYTFGNLGDGLYKLSLPTLPSGKYSYEVTALKDSRTIESQYGEFLVSESSSELAITTRDDELLKGITERASGIFYPFDKKISLWDDLKKANLLETKSSLEESYFFPVKTVYWFILVLILLTSEWLFRKKFSLP